MLVIYRGLLEGGGLMTIVSVSHALRMGLGLGSKVAWVSLTNWMASSNFWVSYLGARYIPSLSIVICLFFGCRLGL